MICGTLEAHENILKSLYNDKCIFPLLKRFWFPEDLIYHNLFDYNFTRNDSIPNTYILIKTHYIQGHCVLC